VVCNLNGRASARDAMLGTARLNGHARQRAESLGMSSVCHAEQCEASTHCIPRFARNDQ